MKVSVLEHYDADLHVILCTEEEVKESNDSVIKDLYSKKDFSGEKDQLCLIRRPKRLLYTGIGKQKEITVDSYRKAMSLAIAAVKVNKLTTLSIQFPTTSFSETEMITALTEGLILSDYSYQKKTEDLSVLVKEAVILSRNTSLKQSVEKTALICNHTNQLRNWINESSYKVTTLYFEEEAKKLAKVHKLGIEVLDEKQLKAKGLNLISAVGQGSQFPPRLIILEYNGDPKSNEKIALVGKGICFDTGGYNLKPTGYMENMRDDMTGAATFFFTIKLAAELKLKKNILAVLCLAENCIGSKAYKPGDVYTAYNGVTVEIGNTDAEGRLVLADGISYTVKNYKPTQLIDYATLTGAMAVALGEHVTGFFCSDDTMSENLIAAAEKTYERIWRLPLYDEYNDDIKGDVADITNSPQSRYGTAVSPALFLKKFSGDTKFAHFDLCRGWASKQRYYIPKNATGIGLRMMVEYLTK